MGAMGATFLFCTIMGKGSQTVTEIFPYLDDVLFVQ